MVYGVKYTSLYPEVKIDQAELYGPSGSNLKDFSLEDDGKLVAKTEDPWIAYSFSSKLPIEVLEISTTEVDDKNGYIDIFDTDTWQVRSGRLLKGNNYYYFYNYQKPWKSKNIRLDLLQVIGASCTVEKVVFNPVFLVFVIGFLHVLIPIFVFLLFLRFVLILRQRLIGINTQFVKKICLLLIKLGISAVATYFILLNFRIVINSTTIVIGTSIVFSMSFVQLPNKLSTRVSLSLVIFSILLALANNLGSHISLGQNPYTDLINESIITPYGWKDIIGIVFITIFFYKSISILICWLPKEGRKLTLKIPFIKTIGQLYFVIPMIIMLVCWSPYFLLYYPGFIFGDSVTSIEQALGAWGLTNHHPVLYTLFIRLCIYIGMMYKDLTFGIAIYTLIQMIFVSFALGKMIEWLSKHQFPIFFCFITTFIFALMPFFGQVSIAMWKDPLFGASFILWTLCLMNYFEAIHNKDSKSEIKYILYGIFTSLLVCFTRNNGVYAILFLLLVISIEAIARHKVFKREFLQFFCSLTSVVIVYSIVTGPVYSHFEIQPTEKVESVGVCLNQMARVAASPDGVMSESDISYMNALLPIKKYPEIYRPCVVDLLKWDPDFNGEYLNKHLKEFFKTYVSIGLKNPAKYIGGWALMTFGYWAPNRWELCSNTNNLENGNFRDLYNSDLDIKQVDVNNLPDNLWYHLFPIKASIIELSIVDWIVLLAYVIVVLSKDKVGIIGLIPSLGVIATLIIASPFWYWQRYGMAQYYLVPIYIFFIAKDLKILG